MIKPLLIIIFSILLTAMAWSANAGIHGAHGDQYSYDGSIYYPLSCAHGSPGSFGSQNSTHIKFVGNGCPNINIDGYVPKSGQYAVVIYSASNYISSGNPRSSDTHASSTMAYIDASIPINDQDITVSSSTVDGGSYSGYTATTCYVLKDSSGVQYTFTGTGACGKIDSQVNPLPPEPQGFKCSLDGSASIDVSLGDIDRSKIGTVPGSTEGISKTISMTCTGQGTGNFNYTFSYTPMSVGDNQLISTSTVGHGSTSSLGVALFMNGTLVKPDVAIARTYSTGTQTETLKFEPIRDPATSATYISTGGFTASAVLIIAPE